MAGILWIKYERFIRFPSPSISDNKKEIYRAHTSGTARDRVLSATIFYGGVGVLPSAITS